MFPVGFTGCIGQVVFSTLWACWASRHKESLYEDSISVGHNVSPKSQRVACIVCEFAVSQVGTSGQSGYTLAESSLSAQGIVTSVHESTYSAGSIHAGGKGLAGSPMSSPYVEAVCIEEDCLMVRHRPAFCLFWTRQERCTFVKTKACSLGGGLLNATVNVIPLEQWLLLMQHYGVCLSRKYVRQLPCTFTRFYRLNVAPSSLISSAILSENVWAYILVTWLHSSSTMYWPSLAVWNSEIERWLLE